MLNFLNTLISNEGTCKLVADQCQLLARLGEFVQTPEQETAHQAAIKSCNDGFNSICTPSYASYCAIAIPFIAIGYQAVRYYLNRQQRPQFQ